MQRRGRFPQNWHAARARRIASGCGHQERALEQAQAPAVSREGPVNGLNGVSLAVQPVNLAESLPPKAVVSAGHDQKECFGRHEFLPLGPRLKARTAEKLFWAPSAFHSGASCYCPREQQEKLSHGLVRVFAKAAVESGWVVQACRPHMRAIPGPNVRPLSSDRFEEQSKLKSFGQSSHVEGGCQHLWCKAIKRRMRGHFNSPQGYGFCSLQLEILQQ